MNLIALFDHLSLDRKLLSQPDEDALIRIEKQIQLERKLNPEIDINTANALVFAIRNERSELSAVLNNRRLFNFFSGKMLSVREFPTVEGVEIHSVRNFIGKYLQDDLELGVDRLLSDNNFSDLDDLLEEKDYFPEELVYKIERKLHGKVDFAVVKAHQNNMSGIDYVKFRSFYFCLSQFSNTGTDDKVKAILNVFVGRYNRNKSDSFAESVLSAMNAYSTDDDDLKPVLEKNHRVITTPAKSGSSWGSARFIFFAVILLLKLIVFGSKCSNDTSSNYDSVKFENSQYANSGRSANIDSLVQAATAQRKTNFGDYLTDFPTAHVHDLKPMDTIRTGSNPFTKKLWPVGRGQNSFTLSNRTDYDLVVFQESQISTNVRADSRVCYVKAHDKCTFAPNDLGNQNLFRFYIGRTPASFNSEQNEAFRRPDSLPEMRFLHPVKNAGRILKKEFMIATDATISQKHGKFELDTKAAACKECPGPPAARIFTFD